MTGRPRRPRMKDVAAEAGVSVMTVSRVVNGESGVAPLTAARVEAAVRKLGYQRDDVARQLRRTDRLSQTIGLMVDNVADPFMAAVASATEDVAHRRGNMVLIGSSRADLRREREVIAAFTARRVDGLILTPVAGDHRVLRSAQARGTKIVCVDRVAPGLDVDTVVVDNFGAVRQAVRHLIAHGHRRICYLGDKPEIWTFGERHRGYLAALNAAGIDADPALVRHGLRSGADAARAVTAILSTPEPPTAVLAGNEVLAFGVRAVLPMRRRVHRLRRLRAGRAVDAAGDGHRAGPGSPRDERRASALRPHPRGHVTAAQGRHADRADPARVGGDPGPRHADHDSSALTNPGRPRPAYGTGVTREAARR